MSKPSEVLTALVDQLKNYAGLDYISDSNILLGAREGIVQFPTLCIEREEMEEEEYAYPLASLKLIANIIMLIKSHDKDRQLVGDATIKGTLDVENDVKLAIDQDRTLGGMAIHTEILDSEDGVVEFPVRSVSLRISIWFRQERAVRT